MPVVVISSRGGVLAPSSCVPLCGDAGAAAGARRAAIGATASGTVAAAGGAGVSAACGSGAGMAGEAGVAAACGSGAVTAGAAASCVCFAAVAVRRRGDLGGAAAAEPESACDSGPVGSGNGVVMTAGGLAGAA